MTIKQNHDNALATENTAAVAAEEARKSGSAVQQTGIGDAGYCKMNWSVLSTIYA
ncbi:hypothetical protein [Alishewanella longhuensis]